MRTIAIFQTEKQMRFRTILTLGTLFAGALALNPSAACADVVRYPIPNSTFPIAQAVQVSGNTATYYVSGQVPPLVSNEAERGILRPMVTPRHRRLVFLARSRGFSRASGSAWAMW